MEANQRSKVIAARSFIFAPLHFHAYVAAFIRDCVRVIRAALERSSSAGGKKHLIVFVMFIMNNMHVDLHLTF